MEQALPAGLMSFPIAIELSVDQDADGNPQYLYVTSSNFGLQYNSGNVQSYDLDKVVEAINTGCVSAWRDPECLTSDYPGDVNDPVCVCEPATDINCAPVPQGVRQRCLENDFQGDINDPVCVCEPLAPPDPGDGPGDECVAVPFDRCSVVPADLQFRDPGAALRLVPVEGLIPGEVEIGSFSDGLAVATDGRRIYVPVRSDANLTFIDVNEEGQLSCGGQFGTRHTCTSDTARGAPSWSTQASDQPARRPCRCVRRRPRGGLRAADDPDDPAFRGDYILMAHREGRASMFFDQFRPGGPEPTKRPRLAATIDELAPEQVTITYEPGAKRAWIPSAEVAAIVRLGIGIDGDPTQSYLFDAGPLFVSGLDTGSSNRDIRFDPRPDRNLAYIVSRSPEALIVARSDVAGGDLNMLGQIPTCRDPSRIQVAEVPAAERHRALGVRELLPRQKRASHRHRQVPGDHHLDQHQRRLRVRHRWSATSHVHRRLQHIGASRCRLAATRCLPRRRQRRSRRMLATAPRPGRPAATRIGAAAMNRFLAIVAVRARARVVQKATPTTSSCHPSTVPRRFSSCART